MPHSPQASAASSDGPGSPRGPSPPRDSEGATLLTLFRVAFALAAVYNLAYGAVTGLWPELFFQTLVLEPPRYPQFFACLGMVVGVYGFLYGWVAFFPDAAGARPIIAVGLLGKVLGPIGMVQLIGEGTFPARMGLLCVFNDMIWWVPFAAFLLRGTRLGARAFRLAPLGFAGLHVLAMGALLLWLQPGTEAEPDPAARYRYVAQASAVWRLGWIPWMLSAQALVLFYAWWAHHAASPRHEGRPRLAVLGAVIGALGIAFDLCGETILIGPMVELARVTDLGALATFVRHQEVVLALTGGAANALYTAGGALLTLASGRLVPRVLAAMLWIAWIAGAAMTASALAASANGLVASSAVLFPLVTLGAVALWWRARTPS